MNIFTLWQQVLCGRRPCQLHSSGQDQRQQSCPAGQECLDHSYLTCFSAPCHEWGVCSMAGPSPPQTTTKCQPNSGHLDNSCGRITLVFNRDKVPPVSNLFAYHSSCCSCVILDSSRVFFVLLVIRNVCAHIQGTTVENICFELRYLPDTRSLAKDHALLLLCDLSRSNQDAIDVAIVSEWSILNFNLYVVLFRRYFCCRSTLQLHQIRIC